MTNTIIKLKGANLASRKTAAAERYRLADVFAGNKGVTVDLREVQSISYSYADELFGVLAAVKGWDWFTSHVKLFGTSEPVLRIIAETIDRRLKETEQQIQKRA